MIQKVIDGTWKSFKAGKEIKSQTYGTYDQPGSMYPKIKFNLVQKLLDNIKIQWKK